MEAQRPDLSRVDPAVRAYVEALEAELDRLRPSVDRAEDYAADTASPDEPPTTQSVITLSAGGIIKRTPRHLYLRQRRGGMGVFDLEIPEEDSPIGLTLADANQGLLAITNRARAFRILVSELPESPVRDRGQPLAARLPVLKDEHVALVTPDQGKGYIALLSQRGYVRCLRHNTLGENMSPGTPLYDFSEFGLLVSACWTSGDDDLFVAARRGNAIRFAERQVPVRGGPGIRLEADDVAVAITAVRPDQGVLLIGADGKGTVRLMSGFNPNKSPGAGGKSAMRNHNVIAARTINPTDDIFIISRLCKIIRFKADEVPATEGLVLGVNCMSLRADQAAAVTVSAALAES